VWSRTCISPLILNQLYAPAALPSGNYRQHQFNMWLCGSHSRSGRFEEKKNPLPTAGTEPRILDHPSRSLLTIPYAPSDMHTALHKAEHKQVKCTLRHNWPWKATRCRRILSNPKVHHHAHNSHLNPVDAISTYFLKIHFNITNMMLLSYKKLRARKHSATSVWHTDLATV
jgi:hypothetical protein